MKKIQNQNPTNRKGRALRGFDVSKYWDDRYRSGRHSGEGSRGEHATRKAGIILRLMRSKNLRRVYDLGCGDMFIMKKVHTEFPEMQYTGVDLSPEIISRNKKNYPWGDFKVVEAGAPIIGTYDLVVCYDVLFHLPKPAFDTTLKILRDAEAPWVILSAWRTPMPNMAQHVFYNEFDPAVIGTVVGRDNLDDYRTSFTLSKEKRVKDATSERGIGQLPDGASGQGTTGVEDVLPAERESAPSRPEQTSG